MAIRFPKPGEIFNQRYELLEILGSGGIGTVFKALQIDADRKIALKILRHELADDQEFKIRFMREAKALSLLNHPGIVTVYHIGVSDLGLPYIAMEFIRGLSVRQLLKQHSKLSALRAVDIARQVADALAFVHANGVVHRDIKPDNLIVVEHPEPDTVKIIDFGLARLEAEQKLTKSGLLLGSVHYMSPEQCQGKPADHRSDIYSLCVCLYEMLSGSRPFEADAPISVVYKHIHEQIPRLQKRELDCFSESINDILSCGMAKQPGERFQSMKELADALAQLYEELNKTAKERHSKGILPAIWTSNKLWIASAGLIVLTVSILVFNSRMHTVRSKGFRVSDEFVARNKLSADSDLPSPNTRITSSAVLLIIKKAGIIQESDRSAAIKLIDSYLHSEKSEARARCLLTVRRAKFEDAGLKKIAFAKQALDIASSEYAKNSDQNSEELYMSCAGFYAENLMEAAKFKEAAALCKSMSSKAQSFHGSGPAQFAGVVRPPVVTDFMIMEADAALQLKDRARAKQIVDQLVSMDFGELRRAPDLVRILFALDRPADVRRFIQEISNPFELDRGMPLYHYEAFRTFTSLCDTFHECLAQKRWDLAELCIQRAEHVDKYASSKFPGGIGTRLKLGMEKSELCFAMGQNKSGEEQLKTTAQGWLAANSPDISKKDPNLSGSNPLGLMLALLKHGLVEEAADICAILSRSIDQYAKNLIVPYDMEGHFLENRLFLNEKLSPYRQNKSIDEFIKTINGMPDPERPKEAGSTLLNRT